VRLVLQRIREHGPSYSPIAYTLWYEHVAGVNPALSVAVTAKLKASSTLDAAIAEQLYLEHIESRNARQVEAMQGGLTLLLRRLGDAVTATGAGAEDYAKSLRSCEAQLAQFQDAEGLQQVVRTLAASTSAAAQVSEVLRREVSDSRAELQELRDRLNNLEVAAFRDPLTELYNRRGFEQAMNQLRSADGGAYARCAVLTADLDHFKRINDTYGHLLGDQVLTAVGKLLRTALKGRDISARFGGEEFVMLLPETTAAGARAIAEQIRQSMSAVRIRKNKGHGEYIDRVTLSMGIAMPLPGECFAQTLERADQALYAAKQAGRNRVHVAPSIELARAVLA
jgi:diguanylate cyclase